MLNIMRINLSQNTIDEITIFDSEFTRWLTSNGGTEDDLIKVNAEVPSGKDADLEEARIHTDLVHYMNVGYVLDDVTYKCIMLTASDARKATSTWINEKFVAPFCAWAFCGLAPQNITLAVNKFMAYLGLLASASKPFEEVFGIKLDPNRIAVIKDGYVEVEDKMDVVTMASITSELRKVRINAFDGFAIINAKLTSGKSQTLRGPWNKIFAQAIWWSSIYQFCKERGIKPVFTDFWGNEVNLCDVDLIITESCFKAVKLYSSKEEYVKAFEANGHKICVCVQEHEPKAKGMPYQQGQTLMGDEHDADEFAAYAASTVAKYSEQKEAIKLLPVWQRAVARMYPALLNEVHTARTIQEKYTSKRNDMRGGRVPELGFNAFLAPDPVAFIEHLFGLPIVGALKAGECFCTTCTEGEVDVTRNPHLDHAHVILNNVKELRFAQGPTMFINIWDTTTLRLRADYDGDHVWYSQNQMLLTLVKKTNDLLKNITIDWDAPSAPKTKINKAVIANYVSNLLHGSEIGLYADALTKMWNSGYSREVCNWLTFAGNVLIDAAKHGSIKIVKPEAVKSLDKVPLPEFCRFAKADKEHPADSPYWDEVRKNGTPRTAYSGSFLDMYSRKIAEVVPETLTINGVDEMIFDVNVMLINPKRKYGRLAGLSRKATVFNPETGKYEDGGLFQRIAFRHADEWEKLISKEDVGDNYAEWEEAKRQEALAEMLSFVRNAYADDPRMAEVSNESILRTVYDIVTRNIFGTKMSDGMDTVVKNAYWRIFGEMAVRVVKDNLEIKEDELIENFDIEDLDLDID